MSEKIIIKSSLKEYYVEFTEDIFSIVNSLTQQNSFFIIDTNIYDLYFNGKDVIKSDKIFLVEANEFNKTIDFSQKVISLLIEKNFKRNDSIVAIGGGIVQDITSFISSILFRGVKWVFVPTTLLAQADSCIGGKSSINFEKVKNLLGTFNPPNNIYIDLKFLNSLKVEDIKSGIGEILHYYYYENSSYISGLYTDSPKLFDERNLFKKYIQESLRIKKEMIEIDEFDKGPRRKFNYGHTFGHAIEALTNYEINHGQAVTIGMDLANYISLNLGFITEVIYLEMNKLLKMNFPYFNIGNYNIEEYFQLLGKDKKNTNTNLTCILMDGPGKLKVYEMEMNLQNKNIIGNYFKKNFNTHT